MNVTPDQVNAIVAGVSPQTAMQCVELSPVHALACSTMSASSLRLGGMISGPAQFQLADSVLWFLVFGALDKLETMAVTSELSMRYLRPGQGSVLWARADLDACGRRNVVGTVRLWVDDQPDRLISVGQGTYVRPR